MQSITFIKIKYNTEVNTAQHILYVYKLKYNEDQQDEHAYRITKPLDNITEVLSFSNLSMVVD